MTREDCGQSCERKGSDPGKSGSSMTDASHLNAVEINPCIVNPKLYFVLNDVCLLFGPEAPKIKGCIESKLLQ